MKLVEQLLHVTLAVEIDIGEWIIVARQELADPERSRTMVGTHEDDVAEPFVDQLRPAEDERPHEHVAQIGIVLDQGQETVPGNQDGARGSLRDDANNHGSTRQRSNFPRELSRPEPRDQRGLPVEDPADLELTFQDKINARRGLPGLDQHLTGGESADRVPRGRALHLPIVEHGKVLRSIEQQIRSFKRILGFNGRIHDRSRMRLGAQAGPYFRIWLEAGSARRCYGEAHEPGSRLRLRRALG